MFNCFQIQIVQMRFRAAVNFVQREILIQIWSPHTHSLITLLFLQLSTRILGSKPERLNSKANKRCLY